MTAYKCATQGLIESLEWGGSAESSDKLCTIGYAVNYLGAKRKDAYPDTDPNYPDNRIVTEDNEVPIEVEKSVGREVEYIRCYLTEMGNPSGQRLQGITLSEYTRFVDIYFKIKYTDSNEEIIVSSRDDIELPQNPLSGTTNLRIAYSGTMADSQHCPYWYIYMPSGEDVHPYEGSNLIATYVGQYASSTPSRNECNVNLYVSYKLIKKCYIVDSSNNEITDVFFTDNMTSVDDLKFKWRLDDNTDAPLSYNETTFNESLSSISVRNSGGNYGFDVVRNTHTDETGNISIVPVTRYYWYRNYTSKITPTATLGVTNSRAEMASNYPKFEFTADSPNSRVVFKIKLSSAGTPVNIKCWYEYTATIGSGVTRGSYTFEGINDTNEHSITLSTLPPSGSYSVEPAYDGYEMFL